MFFSNTKSQSISTAGESENYLPPAPNAQVESPRLIANSDGNIIFSNASFENLCGFRVQNQSTQSLFNINPADENFAEGLYDITLANTQKELSLQFNWVEMQNQWFLVISVEEITAAEKLIQFVSESINQKENHHDDPFESLTSEIRIITDLQDNIISANGRLESVLGYTATHMNIGDIIFQSHMNEYRQSIETGDPAAIPCRSAAGGIVWIEWKSQRHGDQIYAAGQNITQQKNQQNKLAEAEAIGHIGQWHWVTGSDQIMFSDQLFEIFGLTKETFKPNLDNVNAMIHPQDAGRMEQVFQRAVIEQKDYDMDFRLNRPDGEMRYIRCEGRCEINSENDVIALYGIMQDVTETTQRELDLRHAKESVERAYAAKTQFLANMSHELRTPLNAIIGFSEMMERQLLGPIGTEKYLEYIGGIRQSGEHLLDLISDILDMSKIEAGKYELSLEKFNIAKVIRMAVHMMEGRALDENIKIKIDINNEDLQIVADRRAVMQMVLNLLSNAVKFSKSNGVVTIGLKEKDPHFTIRVADQGIGIPANKLINITEPFEQAETDYTREYEGTGLGLAITKELTEIHGGTLHIESKVDVGTTVLIRMPYNAQ